MPHCRLTSAYVRPTDIASHGRTEFSLLEEELGQQDSNLRIYGSKPHVLEPTSPYPNISMCGTLCVPHERKEILPETCSVIEKVNSISSVRFGGSCSQTRRSRSRQRVPKERLRIFICCGWCCLRLFYSVNTAAGDEPVIKRYVRTARKREGRRCMESVIRRITRSRLRRPLSPNTRGQPLVQAQGSRSCFQALYSAQV